MKNRYLCDLKIGIVALPHEQYLINSHSMLHLMFASLKFRASIPFCDSKLFAEIQSHQVLEMFNSRPNSQKQVHCSNIQIRSDSTIKQISHAMNNVNLCVRKFPPKTIGPANWKIGKTLFTKTKKLLMSEPRQTAFQIPCCHTGRTINLINV